MQSPIHLNALRAFEASARHKSFSAAAKELYVTPAAVAQLVRALEEWLGEPLFVRSNSGKYRLTLTRAAKNALPDIQAGFEKLAIGVEKMQEKPATLALNVTLSPAFAAKWLLPRLHTFQTQYPNTDVRLDMSLGAVDFSRQQIDIGVRYGLGNWAGLNAEKLMNEEVFPVCSPTLLAENSLNHPEDLLAYTLIHDLSMAHHESFPTWQQWLTRANVTTQNVKHTLKINDSAAVLQSAIDGAGIALARSVMAFDDIAAGRLIRLFPHIHFASPLAYYVVYQTTAVARESRQLFRDWLFTQVSYLQ